MYSNILNEGCPKRYMKLIHYMYTGVLYKCIQEFLQWPVPVHVQLYTYYGYVLKCIDFENV